MLDSFDRDITYLRISVTDRCNLRCTYCMPAEGIPHRPQSELLSYEEIARVVQSAAGLGFTKVRLTGGEPLVRRDLVVLVEKIARIPGIREIGMTTNGTLLPRHAHALRTAGLSRVNISIDTLDPGRYGALTRGGQLERALEGVNAARAEGFVIKINSVVSNETTREELESLQRFCDQNGYELQLIQHYLLNNEKHEQYRFSRPPKCANCNRIRLLSDGVLKPCLQSNLEIPLDPEDVSGSLKEAVRQKPEKGTGCTNRTMAEIGG